MLTITDLTFDFLTQRRVEGDDMPQIFFKKVMVVQERGDFEVSYFHFLRARSGPYRRYLLY